MADTPTTDPVVANPTYMADIRHFFRPVDIEHMASMGYNLATYDGVKKHALEIHFQTQPPDRLMPRGPVADKWSPERSQTFRNWIINGCPLGAATPQPAPDVREVAPGGRVRRNIASLSQPEIDTLAKAFSGVMARDASDPNGYYAMAGAHGLPGAWCAHHDDPFNPWHRTFLKLFEDQLRTISGCEEVTLPYWDITTLLPDVLQQAPFAAYKLPEDPGATADPPEPGTYFPYTTSRNDPATIQQNMTTNGVYEDIATSITQSLWGTFSTGGYQSFSMQAHDGGHDAIGPTMGDQNVAAFDPIFWFFHCNLDRLWLNWQISLGATTLTGFKTTIAGGDTSWLSAPFNGLPPFEITADETIGGFGVSYEQEDAVSAGPPELENKAGSIEAARTFSIKRSSPVSVRVKDIARLDIPGTFRVKLLADGQPVAQRAFFQPKTPRHCSNCRKLETVNIDFRIDQEKIFDKKLSVEIEVPALQHVGDRFPLSQAGNPTLNARLLIDEG
ncbi:MAG TPA: tyrosinase family protein [Thermoleophilaceae bacterium]